MAGLYFFLLYLYWDFKKNIIDMGERTGFSLWTARFDGIQKFQRIKKYMYIYIYLDQKMCGSQRSRKQQQKAAGT